jgi:hypothetical protein
MKIRPLFTFATFAGLALIALPASAQLVRSASGLNAAGITPSVTDFRNDLGTLNPNNVGSVGSGRREINWDGVPDAFSAPNNLPPDFFNVNSPRGVVLATPGTGFQISANSGVAPVEFGNIDANYPTLFAPFSSQKLFTALGSNITDVRFFIPGTTTAAVTTGFGAVFTDVDGPGTTSLEFFNASNTSLGVFGVPFQEGNETLSFLGVSFPSAVVARVRVTSGNQVLAAGNSAFDIAVMDDFIYGEPRLAAVPEPTGALAALGVIFVGVFSRGRRFRETSAI